MRCDDACANATIYDASAACLAPAAGLKRQCDAMRANTQYCESAITFDAAGA
jgi:hypothetical protein